MNITREYPLPLITVADSSELAVNAAALLTYWYQEKTVVYRSVFCVEE
jgi:hypothetical protein